MIFIEMSLIKNYRLKKVEWMKRIRIALLVYLIHLAFVFLLFLSIRSLDRLIRRSEVHLTRAFSTHIQMIFERSQ